MDVVERARQAVVPVRRGHQVARQPLDHLGIGGLAGVGDLALVLRKQRLERDAARRQLLARPAVLLQTAEAGAQHAHGPVGPLGVAAEPEQVVGGAARQVVGAALHLRHLDGRPPQADVRRQIGVADHPDVARLAFGGAERHRGAFVDGHGQAARHGDEAVGGGGHEQAHGVGFGHQTGRRQRRRGAEADLLLGDEQRAPQLDVLQQGRPLGRPHAGRVAAGHGTPWPGRALVRRADDHAVEVGERMPPRRRLAQPRARSVGDDEILAQQFVGKPRQIGAEAAVLGQRRAQRVDHQVGLLAHGLQQPHRPGKARRIQFERIGDGAGDAAHDQVDRHQAFERLQRDAVADHAQVAALHQQQAEVAGKIGMAEEIVVARARREQGNGRVGAIGATRERGLQLLEERRQPLRAAGAEQVAGDVGVHHAVGERVADAGRRLGVRVDHAPAAVGAARQIGREELDVATGRPEMLAWPQVGRIAEHQLMRNGAGRQQALRPVDIGEHRLEQPGALNQPALQLAPFLRREDERHQVHPPRLRGAGRVGEQIVGDAGLAHPRVQVLHARRPGRRVERGQLFEKRQPLRPDRARCRHQLVEARHGRPIAGGQIAGRQHLGLAAEHVRVTARCHIVPAAP